MFCQGLFLLFLSKFTRFLFFIYSNFLHAISPNVPGCMRHFFAPDKEKCEAFFRAQKMWWSKAWEWRSHDLAERNPNRRTGGLRIQSCYAMKNHLLILFYIFFYYIIKIIINRIKIIYRKFIIFF